MKADTTDIMRESLFEQLGEFLLNELKPDENLSLSLSGEHSLFTRFNSAQIRQTGVVDELGLHLDYSHDHRHLSSTLTLQGQLAQDRKTLSEELSRMRYEARLLPPDPFIVLPAAGQTSYTDVQGKLLDEINSVERLLPAMQGMDLSGIWASGRIYRAHMNSAGSKHWFASDSYSLDYSVLNEQHGMVKGTLAGSDWQPELYRQSLQDAEAKLKLMQLPSIRIKPGLYRTYIASAGVADLLGMFSWHGLSEAALQTGDSAFARMRNDGVTLSPRFSLAEDFNSAQFPRFNAIGEVAAEKIELIIQGQLKTSLVSSRSAAEFGLQSNFANDSETLRSPSMACGELQQQDELRALDTGVYLSNLHYLNWSDVATGRITGMTRYACFWVENGAIIGPLQSMRFDDSFYHFFGDNLESVSDQVHFIPDVGTYGGRAMGMTLCPGILLNSFCLTL